MNKIRIVLQEDGEVKDECVINRDHVVLAKSEEGNFVKVVDIVCLSSKIRIIFYGYRRNDPGAKQSIDDDVKRILNHILDEGDGSYTLTLISRIGYDIEISLTNRCGY